ncbi:hypothetical protein PAPYR_2502 [Paratrimastix pyriformis]|uniref:VHS domain-containing protein n=1 Tax=Paratrimastix pyriformis TaxID=342808 RepID=A0ABQ8UUL4_9EUKA|nr:hypothetical protein PAPYR_2502 [Paratrimastix pyriformis]
MSVENAISAATHPDLPGENTELTRQVIQLIRGEPAQNVPLAVAKFGTLLSSSNQRQINLALHLLEACTDHCGVAFVMELSQKRFLDKMEKLITSKKIHRLTQERAISLLCRWANTFRPGSQLPLPSFLALCQSLRSKGLEFGELQERVERERAQPASPSPPPPTRYEKLLADLQLVRENATLLTEIVVNLHPGESIQDNELAAELALRCRQFAPRLIQLCGELTDERVLVGLLHSTHTGIRPYQTPSTGDFLRPRVQ